MPLFICSNQTHETDPYRRLQVQNKERYYCNGGLHAGREEEVVAN